MNSTARVARAARPRALPLATPTAPLSTRLVRAAYAALAWVVVFFTFHVYWYLGGSFGVGGEGYRSSPAFGGRLDL